jgi:replicative DNA helicase
MDYEDMEATILKGFVRDRQLITIALNEGFTPELLPSPVARRLCNALIDLYLSRGGEAITEVTVRTHLENRGVLNAEMEHYLRAVTSMRPPDAGRLMSFVESLRNRDSRERLQSLHDQLGSFLGGSEDVRGDLVQFTTEMMQKLIDLQKQRVRRRLGPVTNVLTSLIEDSARLAGHEGLLGFSISPFDRLNALLSGMRRGFYYGLAGAPRRGKSNFALELATYVAGNHHVPVLYYSWEQTSRVLGARLLAKEAGIDPATILAGGKPGGEPIAPQLMAAQERMARFAPYVFLVEGGRQDTLSRIRTHVYNVMQEFQTSDVVIFLDYLQKIPLEEYVEDWKARNDLVSTALAEMSLELNCPIFAISPLDKEGCRLDERPAEDDAEYSEYERPTMHHSMGSGDLEYDLDVAMVLAKDWKATKELHEYLESHAKSENLDPETLPHIDIVNLFVDKNRDAPASASYIVQYAFFVTLNKFVELDYKLEKEFRADYRGFAKLQQFHEYLVETGLLKKAEPARA